MFQRISYWIAAGLALGMLGLAVIVMQHGQIPIPRAHTPSFATLIDLDAKTFTPLDTAWKLTLPTDHGPHANTLGERWSLSLWLHDGEGQDFAFQVELARLALSAQPIARTSAWAPQQLYRAQLAASLPDERRVRTRERLARDALGLAGATAQPIRIWVGDWSLGVAEDNSQLDLEIADGDLGMQLAVIAVKPALDGRDLGLFVQDRDSPELQAYLMPRLAVKGLLSVDGKQTQVQGSAWLDHLWGNFATSGGTPALDRIAIQLDDGRDLVCLQLRPRAREGKPIPTCALILTDGRVQSFQRREIRLESTRIWQSETSQRRYPVAWQLAIPLLDLELAIEPRMTDQELDLATPYWSGPARISGLQNAQQLGGHGWVEVYRSTTPP